MLVPQESMQALRWRGGTGREKGVWGLLENLELKAITGALTRWYGHR